MNTRPLLIAALLGLATASMFTACAPLAVVGGAMVAIDRRSAGTQLEDQAIEVKALARIQEALGDRGHVSTTSYNRMVLISGEVPTEADRKAAEAAIARIENVRSVVNELGVIGSSSLGSRSSDALVTTKVKASFFDAKDLQANAFKVVTERGVVYLMGRVTEREAGRAVEITRTVSGVQKVVRVLEILSEAELAEITRNPPQK